MTNIHTEHIKNVGETHHKKNKKKENIQHIPNLTVHRYTTK